MHNSHQELFRSDEDVKLSKAMSKILRHTGDNVPMGVDGFVPISDLVKSLGRGWSQADVERCVSRGTRFEIRKGGGILLVRATAGHTLSFVRVGQSQKRKVRQSPSPEPPSERSRRQDRHPTGARPQELPPTLCASNGGWGRRVDEGITMPAQWCRDANTSALDFIRWYHHRYQVTFLDDSAKHQWALAALTFQRMATPGRELRIHAWAADRGRQCCQCIIYVNHGPHYLDMRGHGLDLHRVTGIDFCVQSVLTMHTATAAALKHAVEEIELGNHADVVFVCDGGTHRSLGCACLLAMLAYPGAQVLPGTSRTWHALQGCV